MSKSFENQQGGHLHRHRKLFENMPGAFPSRHHERIYGRYEKIYTINDVCAALLFLGGSAMFFYASLQNPAIWCFVIGSFNFLLRPLIKLTREFHLTTIPMPGDDPRVGGHSQ